MNLSMISVIMGVYNGERFLRESIDSVLNQTYSNFEFLICNDCSSDSSVDILEEYAALDSRIKIIHNKNNMGLAASLNRCIDMAQGEFLARMDCDDRCASNRFETQIEFLNCHKDVSVVGSNVYYMDDKGEVYGQSALDTGYISFFDAVKYNPLVHPTVMMRTEAVKSVNRYTVNALTSRAEDFDLWCKMCEKGYRLCSLQEPLLYYREDMSNIVRRKYHCRIEEARLKYYWQRRANTPAKYLLYVVKPLLVGIIPLKVYRKLHKTHLTSKKS